MSRAFVKEPDGSEPIDDLTERPIGPERNLVTAKGLAQIDAEIARMRDAQAEVQKRDDKMGAAVAARDLRYWQARRDSAEVAPQPVSTEEARFGLAVTLDRVGGPAGGGRRVFRIVGMDEADPERGLISYVSPMAQAVIGKGVGDVVEVGPAEWEIVAIEL